MAITVFVLVAMHRWLVEIAPVAGTSSSKKPSPSSLTAIPMSASNQVSSISTSNFAPIFRAACDEYKKLTDYDLATHPFASELERCDSPGSILDVLRREAQTLIKRRKRHEKLFACLNPIVNVMFTLSGTLGEGIGLVSISSFLHWCP